MWKIKGTAKSLIAAGLLVFSLVGSASATAIFESDETYKLSGSFGWGFMGLTTFAEGSTLRYDSNSKQLTVDAKVTSNVYKGQAFNLDLAFGAINFANGASDINPGSEVDVSFANGSSKATFGILPGPKKLGETMIGTLEATQAFDLYNIHTLADFHIPAGFDFAVMATGNMSPVIRAQGNSLYFDAWLRLWGDKGNAHWDAVGDLHTVTLTKVPGTTPPGTEVPEPMTMSLLAAGLLGKAFTRRRLKAA